MLATDPGLAPPGPGDVGSGGNKPARFQAGTLPCKIKKVIYFRGIEFLIIKKISQFKIPIILKETHIITDMSHFIWSKKIGTC